MHAVSDGLERDAIDGAIGAEDVEIDGKGESGHSAADCRKHNDDNADAFSREGLRPRLLPCPRHPCEPSRELVTREVVFSWSCCEHRTVDFRAVVRRGVQGETRSRKAVVRHALRIRCSGLRERAADWSDAGSHRPNQRGR